MITSAQELIPVGCLHPERADDCACDACLDFDGVSLATRRRVTNLRAKDGRKCAGCPACRLPRVKGKRGGSK